jgi:hypothetical protein
MNIRYCIAACVYVVTLLLCQHTAAAETIVLKSGKTIEGAIVEKADTYIKVDIGGAILTYYRDELLADAALQPASTHQDDADSWYTWFSGITGYLKKMNEVSRKVENYQKQAEVLIIKARQSKDKAMLAQGLGEIDHSFDLALNELSAIEPPGELAGFHSNIKKSVVSGKAIVKSAFEDRKEDIRMHLKESVSAMRDAYLVLMDVCRKHGVPEQELASVENVIRLLDSFIGYGDMKPVVKN